MGTSEERGKILFIVQLPPPVHGASIMNNYVVKSDRIKSRYDITVLNLQFLTSIRDITRFSISKIFKAIYYGFELIWKIVSLKPDLIYFSFSPKGYSFYRDAFYVYLIKLFKRELVLHLHGKGVKEGTNGSPAKKKIYKKVFRNTSVICLSDKLVEDIAEVYDNKPIILPNGIEEFKTNGGLVRRGSHPRPRILCLSNYMIEKGILDLITALGLMKQLGHAFQAILVGAPIDLTEENLKNEIIARNLVDCVEIAGPLYGSDKVNALNDADIFVLPSRNEAFPIVILEAMQSGLPVVSTLEGGISDMVLDKQNGFLTEKENPQLLADMMTLLLNDSMLRSEMGTKGRQRFLENYTLDRFEERLVRALDLIISGAGQS
jgi:glycosyltransferase involved in cell wall biosynthesis